MEIKAIEWFDDRFYKITFPDGKVEFFPSTTTKLNALPKPHLEHWRGDIGNREADLRMREGGDRGSRLHHAWQTFVKGGVIIYNPYHAPLYTQEQILDLEKQNNFISILQNQDEMYAIYKMQQWWNIIKPVLIESEQILYSLKHKEAGTMDTNLFIEGGEYQVNGSKPLKLDKGYYIHDLKTGKSIGNDAYMQVADYLKMAEEMQLGKFEGALITHTEAKTKNGIEGLATIFLNREDIEKYYEDFRAIAKVWDSQFGDTKPKIMELPSIIKQNG